MRNFLDALYCPDCGAIMIKTEKRIEVYSGVERDFCERCLSLNKVLLFIGGEELDE